MAAIILKFILICQLLGQWMDLIDEKNETEVLTIVCLIFVLTSI